MTRIFLAGKMRSVAPLTACNGQEQWKNLCSGKARQIDQCQHQVVALFSMSLLYYVRQKSSRSYQEEKHEAEMSFELNDLENAGFGILSARSLFWPELKKKAADCSCEEIDCRIRTS